MKPHISILIILMLTTSLAFSQYRFSDYQNSTVLMPSFAGYDGTKFTTKYRDQYPNVPGTYTTIQASAEHQLANFNSGVGIQFLRYNESNLSKNSFEIMYSYDFKINEKLHIRPGAQFSFNYMSIDWQNLTWRDQLNGGGTTTTIQPTGNEKVIYPDAGASVLGYGNNYWFGMGASNLLMPKESLYRENSKQPIQFIANGGYIIHPKGNLEEAITLHGLYKKFGQFDQIDLGATWNNKFIIGGLTFSGMSIGTAGDSFFNSNAVTTLIGFKYSGISLKYSYDFVISQLVGVTGGAHEITLSYSLKKQ